MVNLPMALGSAGIVDSLSKTINTGISGFSDCKKTDIIATKDIALKTLDNKNNLVLGGINLLGEVVNFGNKFMDLKISDNNITTKEIELDIEKEKSKQIEIKSIEKIKVEEFKYLSIIEECRVRKIEAENKFYELETNRAKSELKKSFMNQVLYPQYEKASMENDEEKKKDLLEKQFNLLLSI